MHTLDNLTVFFPAYNEEESIENVVEKALSIIPEFTDNFEVLVINDGSIDNTENILIKLSEKHKNVNFVSHPVNKGYGAALKTGFKSAQHSNIFFSDGDGQFDIKELSNLIPHLDDNDIVAGYRIKRNDPFHRILNGKAYNMLVRLLFGLKVRDIDCAFKLFKKDAVNSLELKSNAAFISAELLIRAKNKGLKISQVGVHHYPREKGSPTGNNPFVVIRSFQELFKLRKELI